MRELPFIRRLEELRRADVALVGGKNASLGEMIAALGPLGVRVPPGFAITAAAFRHLVESNELNAPIAGALASLGRGEFSLEDAGRAVRERLLAARLPADLENEIRAAYRDLSRGDGVAELAVAVRSSATAEDLPGASFAGQQETFLNVRGERELLDACRRCWASLYTDRAIAYRERMGFAHSEVALSIGVQKMVRSDRAGAGVMFTLDTESGFPRVVVINAAWGLGELVVQGSVTPDQYTVFKPLLDEPSFRPILDKRVGEKAKKMIYGAGGTHATAIVDTTDRERVDFVLTDEEILQLARWAVLAERHYGVALDMEWAKDGDTGELYLVQARPETVHSRSSVAVLRTWRLIGKIPAARVSGLAVGQGVVVGRVCRVDKPSEAERVPPGSILVTETTDPDWVPVMRRVAGIVTDLGGRTCHAAIVARELGVPAIVGTGTATHVLREGEEVTLACASGELGHVYAGALPFDVDEAELSSLAPCRTRVMVNLGDPAGAFRAAPLLQDGIGLARMEFIIGNLIKVHPMALVRFDELTDEAARNEIITLTRGYVDKREYFVDRLARGIATLAAACYPAPAIVRLSDFKTNEYAALLGGRQFEPREENPMLGWRGASRYYSDGYREGFALECRALRRVREEIGLTNVIVMVPFCRTLGEADRVLREMALHGLVRGRAGLEVYVMCEIPSNVILAERFAERFDGFSIGSNDLTQLVLGVDRDSAQLAGLFDERDPAVVQMITEVIRKAHAAGRKIGICGQAPSDHPEYAELLVNAGIDSISVNPDSAVAARRRIADVEAAHAVALVAVPA